jgi:hypothetical protein
MTPATTGVVRPIHHRIIIITTGRWTGLTAPHRCA